MKCIYCSERIHETTINCPKCGKPTQMVPDYSIYDDDNIHVLLEGTKTLSLTKETTKTAACVKELSKIQKRKAEEAKKKQAKRFLKLVCMVCMIVLIIGVMIKTSMENSRPNSLSYQLKKGNAAFAEQDYESAQVYFEQANRLDPKNCEILYTLSQISFQLQQEEQAYNYLKKIIQLDSAYKAAYSDLLEYYEKQKDTTSILALIKTTTNPQVLDLFNDYIVETPTVNLKGGTYQEYIRLALSSKMNTNIYYTLDGSDPVKKGIRYRGQIAMEEMGTFTLKAVSKNGNGIYSEVLIQEYHIEIAPPQYPVVSPESGVYTTQTYVSVDIPSGCSAYYTWDNTTPTEEAALYVAPILIPEGKNQILSVVIIDNHTGLESSIYRGSYDYTPGLEETMYLSMDKRNN